MDLLNTFLLISYAQHKFLSEIKESRNKRFSFYLVKISVQVWTLSNFGYRGRRSY